MDKCGILRCRGPLTDSTYTHDLLYPKLLPRKNSYTSLVIRDCHEKLFHSGVAHTLSQIRHQYWTVQGRREVQCVLKQCQKCKRTTGGPFRMPNMPPWPSKRVTASPPFTFTGLDYFGPLYTREDGAIFKRWICLFTCLSIRAIHLEVVNDLSADQFLLSFRRFVARRGKPAEVVSDNAKQFKLAKSVLERLWLETVTSDSLQSYVASQGIRWNFIVNFAPWMGGFYERLVGLVKLSLKKSLGKACLTIFQLQTVAAEIESVINSRPLIYIESEIDTGVALTPAHFLMMNPKTGVPVLEEDTYLDFVEPISLKEHLLEKWKLSQQSINNFWRVWVNDYLLSLRERYQRALKQGRGTVKEFAKSGTVVLLEDKLPRGSWRMGIITELIPGQDGQIRTAKLRLSSGTIVKRTLNRLYPLECTNPYGETKEERINEGQSTEYDETKEPVKQIRGEGTVRIAAQKAKRRIAELFSKGLA